MDVLEVIARAQEQLRHAQGYASRGSNFLAREAMREAREILASETPNPPPHRMSNEDDERLTAESIRQDQAGLR